MTEPLALLVLPDDAESVAAKAWLQEREWGIVASHAEGAIREARTIWCHAGTTLPDVPAATLDACGAAVDRGGLLVLTGLAALLAPALGMPGIPRVEPPRTWYHADDPLWPGDFRDWPEYPHVRGVQGWGPHPLFKDLGTGTFTWMAREGDPYSSAMLPRAEWGPLIGVIGVNRWYVHLDASAAVAWEYQRGAGHILCIGAHVWFTGGDAVLHPHRNALVANALRRGASVEHACWPGAAWQHARVGPIPRPRAIESAGPWTAPGPIARSTSPTQAPWSLGAPQGLATGTESGGIGELWLHPLLVSDGVTVVSEEELTCVESTTSGYVVSRSLRCSEGHWTERLLPSRIAPEWGYEVYPSSGITGSVALEITCPLRLQWPMPSDLLHPLRTEVRREGERWVVVVSGSDGRHVMALFADAQSVVVVASDTRPTIRIVSAPGEGIRLLVRASKTGAEGLIPATTDLAQMAHAATVEAERRGAHHVRLGLGCRNDTQDTTTITLAMDWATTRLSSFVSGAMGGQAGLMAGYAATRPGWGVSRPGYAWHFGRDSCWCVDAMLAAGMFEEAEIALDCLAARADLTGKIPHEVTTSGVVHHDAADATPLFLRAVAMYALWTGNLGAITRWWPVVTRSFAHVVSCDRDGDGLPENDGVGHGWIEMGPLGGGSVTSYVAAIWVDALRLLGPLAGAMGDDALAAAVQGAHRRAGEAIEGLRLSEGWLALHRTRAGSLDPTLTALAAVPIALGVSPSALDVSTLDRLSSPDYTTPWGVRLLARSDPRYAPRGYHTGAVWPLFTGWVALADARVGNIDRALEHMVAVAVCVDRRERGAFDEVLDGDTGDAAGVCPDQAWSAAAAITPLVHGILGVQPRATAGACTVALRLPEALQYLTLHGLRIGRTRVDCTWRRDGDVVCAEWLHLSGPPLTVDAGDPARGRLLSAQHPYAFLNS